jgi:hypothetical protein
MRRSNTSAFSDLFREYIRSMGLEKQYFEAKIINAWPEIAGKAIASRTKRMYFKNSVLFVELTSSVVRNELMMIRHGLIDALNKYIGQEIVTDIIFR